MPTLFIDPHGDDVALFAAYSRLGTDAVAMAYIPNPTVPLEEVGESMRVLDFFWATSNEMVLGEKFDRIYAPAFHPEGHDEHNEAAEFALTLGAPVVPYCTYAPRGQRTRTDNEVPYEPWMVARKLRALSCFESQIEQESTRPWFTYLLDVREWLA